MVIAEGLRRFGGRSGQRRGIVGEMTLLDVLVVVLEAVERHGAVGASVNRCVPVLLLLIATAAAVAVMMVPHLACCLTLLLLMMMMWVGVKVMRRLMRMMVMVVMGVGASLALE